MQRQLDLLPIGGHISAARQSDGYPLRFLLVQGEESPGSTETRCRVTPGGGDLRESATESKPPVKNELALGLARVKGCGKSAPRLRQRGWQGKPHREQDQIEVAIWVFCLESMFSCCYLGRSREASGNGRPR